MARSTRSLLRGRLVPTLALALGLSMTLGACVSGSPATGDAPEQSGDAYSGEVEWWTINLQKNYGPDIRSRPPLSTALTAHLLRSLIHM